MNPTIVFNKEEAEKYIRENICVVLDYGKPELIKRLAKTVAAYAVTPACLFALFYTMVYGNIKSSRAPLPSLKDVPVQWLLVSALIGAGLGFTLFCLIHLSDYSRARGAYQEYKRNKNASIHKLYEWYLDYCGWCDTPGYVDIDNAYDNYCALSSVSAGFLNSSYTARDCCITFKYAKENGDVDNVDVYIDKVKENCNIENDTLTWKEGEVILTKKYQRKDPE